MKPTKEKFTDPSWWDNHAGTASHYCPVNAQFYDARLHPCCISRPEPTTPWQGPQDGLPPEGALVTVVNPDCYSIEYGQHLVGTGEPVKVATNYTSSDGVECSVVEHDGGGYVFRSSMLRPIQSERDKLATIISKAVDTYFDDCLDAADQVISAGYRKPMSRASAIDKISAYIALNQDKPRSELAAMIADALGYKEPSQ